MDNLALDRELMFKAIKEAKRGIPHVYPNPAVGCVIHDGGKILSTGYHKFFVVKHEKNNALKKLEYRGYDSAGISAIKNRKIERCRAAGKLSNLERALVKQPISGSIGIGHTRWATHGVPSIENAHPHVSGQVAVVHNGIIENYQQLKEELANDGVTMQTETDTEVVAHLANAYLQAGMQPKDMMQALLSKIQGAFALLIICLLYTSPSPRDS